MKHASAFLLSGTLAFVLSAPAQRFVTNKLSSAQASKVASRLTVGIGEWEMYGFLRTNGLVGGTIGNTFSGTAFFVLSDGCHLDLKVEVEPGSITNRLLRSASISSNGVKITSITLKKRPNPAPALDGGIRLFFMLSITGPPPVMCSVSPLRTL